MTHLLRNSYEQLNKVQLCVGLYCKPDKVYICAFLGGKTMGHVAQG